MKGKKVLKIILLVVSIFIIVALIYFLRSYMILNKIAKLEANFVNSKNYSVVRESYSLNNNSEKQVTTEKYIDGKLLIELANQEITIWHDEKTNETLTLFQNTNEAFRTQSNQEIFPDVLNLPITQKSDVISYTFSSAVKSVNFNGEKCYLIKSGLLEYYISQNTGLLLRYVNGNLTLDFKDYKFDALSESEVAKPDLTEYHVF